MWKDSAIVLAWIQGPSTERKNFLGNRVALIQENIAATTWRHVPTNSNPADLISRGIEATALSTSTLWWKGPQWLTQQPSDQHRTVVNTPTDNLEIKNVHVAVLHSGDIIQRFSKLNSSELLHTVKDSSVTARIPRPTDNLLPSPHKNWIRP